MESRVIKTWRDPYDEGFSTTRLKQITINKGLTVLVGCNGIGKTTLIHNIIEELKKYSKTEKIPYYKYDNLYDGGNTSISELLFRGRDEDTALAANLMTSSEGETILCNISQKARQFAKFLKTGKIKNGIDFSFMYNDEEEIPMSNERWLLFDATDSGLSIDAIIELKSLFNLMIKDAENIGADLYIIISANEYELARNEECFDVSNGKYIRFKDYEDYRKFIINNRKKKDKRYKKKG